ncbi:hypothetical protein NDU88_001601 [Pleurodeles waltl]|uniref:Uncharacterized protein n=1 Tax=Pleurodeles waltl TaxID=8319 RepID=A0AAV7MT77_PLEWA|nr:hypothetical protein NDU88_001601 [Pleurodeles waltl]
MLLRYPSILGGRGLAAGQDGRHQVRLSRASGQNSVFLFILWTSAAGAGLAVPPRGPRRQVEHCGGGRERRCGRAPRGRAWSCPLPLVRFCGEVRNCGRSRQLCTARSESVCESRSGRGSRRFGAWAVGCPLGLPWPRAGGGAPFWALGPLATLAACLGGQRLA